MDPGRNIPKGGEQGFHAGVRTRSEGSKETTEGQLDVESLKSDEDNWDLEENLSGLRG